MIVLFLFVGESVVSNKEISQAASELSLLGCSRREVWGLGLLSLADFLGHWPLDPPHSCCLNLEAYDASVSALWDVQVTGQVLGKQICMGRGSDPSPPVLSPLTSSYWWLGSLSLFSTWRSCFKYCLLGKLFLWIPSALHHLGTHSLWICLLMLTSCRQLTAFVLDTCGFLSWIQSLTWKEKLRIWP